MKKKYIIGILLFLVLIALGFGLFITSKSHTNKANSPKKTNITKNNNNQKKTENSKYKIPSEYVGDWYQKDKKTKITKTSVQMAIYPNHTFTKDSKPIPLDVHKQGRFQFFWQGALMDNTEWQKDGSGMPFWIAKMTIDGQKQNVLASINKDDITVWTPKPTSKDYSFELSKNESIPNKPIMDLDNSAKNGTRLENDDTNSNDNPSNPKFTQKDAQALVPGAINKYLDKSMSFEPVGSYSDATGWSFKINDDLTLHVIPDDSNNIRFEFYNTSSDDQHIEGTISYDKKSGKYLSPADSSESSDSDDQSTDESDNSSDTNKNNSDEDDN